ncbi:hypothetical protein LQ564_12235 [Massilia sp. G4R7]|uniref:Uncharacterized protein n=1 Tax=Massilia phyllostachyos TaxID=2898585 RepID=A0ABS8Q635_9BURK|nr:hypothetical protein [Massilia phyllostachyos]MCD2517074.1 hypothetical protein [Massilia phyllostachyos]
MQWLTHACRALVATLLAGACSAAVAEDAPNGWTAVDADTLDEARGGFETPGGLNLSLGIERVVSINGEIMSRTNVAISDLNSISADQLAQARDALGAARLIQIGGNNVIAPDLGLANGATLVQNTLNDQTIQTYTTITSTVNSMALIKDINFNGTVRDAIVRSAGSM